MFIFEYIYTFSMKLINKIILTRPYSWIIIVLLGILANIIANKNFIIDANLFFDCFVAILVWFATSSASEFFHRNIDKRGVTSPKLPIVLFFILAFSLIYKNILTIIFLPILIVAVIAYSYKIKNWFLSSFSFLIRGVLEICVILIVLFFHGFYSIVNVLPIIISVYLLTISRNLIGDIRDVKFDKYTFPKKYGSKTGYIVSSILVILSLILIPNIEIMLPMILYLVLLLISRNAYLLHRLSVMTMIFIIANYALFMLNQNLFFTNIIFVGVLLNFTYPLVPRKSNPTLNL
jgi:hypothetical protein